MVTVGDRFGKLRVEELAFRKAARNYWSCRCDCGKITIVVDYDLQRKKRGIESCGCLRKEKCGKPLEDLTGRVFNKLTVVSKTDERRSNRVIWKTVCECGEERLHYATTLRSGKVISCGCHKSAKAKERSKENHYNWKGGITSQNTKDRNSERYAVWRTTVFERDNYNCKACKLSKKEINAHHIECFHGNVELRFVVENGITLCKDCHDLFHHKFGKLNNNSKQFREFLEVYNEK